MRGKAVHIFAAIAESLRFLAVAFLAFSVGALLNPGASSLLRYAAAPQLLFAAGFFFMWLDPERYSSYRPLLAVGKAASAVCFLPLAAAVVADPQAGSSFGLRGLGLALCLFLAAVDLASLCILAFAGPAAAGSGRSGPSSAPGGSVPPAGPSSGDVVEKVEGL